MAYESRRYLIIPASIADNIDFSQVFETSKDTLVYSIDGSKTFVKYDVTIINEDTTQTYVHADTGEEHSSIMKAGVYGRPSIYSEEYPEYTHEEILEVLQTEEWFKETDNIS